MTLTYPAHREADVVLRDGSTVHVRPIRREDESRLISFFESLSVESRRLRFFSAAVDLAAMARLATNVDYVRSFGLVATFGPDDRIVGQASYVATAQDSAEVAFTIANDFQGRGLGTILLGHLAEIASGNGIRVFEADVLPINRRMIDVFRESGFAPEVEARPEELRVTFPTSFTDEAIERFERREQIGAIGALEAFFKPRSVAVIGASRRRGTVGGEVFHNLLAYEFTGPVYPVNPTADVVQCVPAYKTVGDIPGPVDLAVIVVPAAQVLDVTEQCGRKGVRALVVISAGFGETGPAGRERQAELVRICRANGMRLIGPNCIGIVSTHPEVRLNASFGPLVPTAGHVGFSSQSGALGLAAIDYAGARGIGLSNFVSAGNKADLSGNDLLNYWETDSNTNVILLYLESIGNPRKFTRIARRVGRSKPVVVVKSGRSSAGARATSSHTGALLAASDVTVDALFRQSGVIRTDTLEGMFDVASLLANQPIPKGKRVGIVTNAGGPGILAADTLEADGLEVPLLTEETQQQLRRLLPAEASVANPVDMIASASAEQFRKTLSLVAADPNVDSILSIFIPPLVTKPEDIAAAIVDAARAIDRKKPLLWVFMSSGAVPEELRAGDVHIPTYAFPEAAAIALAHATHYGTWREQPVSSPRHFEGLRRDDAAAIVARALGNGSGWLGPQDLADLFACYGLPLVEQRLVKSPDDAGAAAAELGGEIALKAIAPGVIHKTEMGAVRLNLRGTDEVRDVALQMTQRLTDVGQPPTGFLLQRMAPQGVEMIIGIVHDPQFGPVVAVGAGGVLVELLKDVSVRLTPLTERDASDMIRNLKSYPRLEAFRGRPASDVAALEDVLLRVSAMAEDLPQILELDCNPVMVLEEGAVIVDARVKVGPTDPPRPLGARR